MKENITNNNSNSFEPVSKTEEAHFFSQLEEQREKKKEEQAPATAREEKIKQWNKEVE